jgi:sarcosine oxidase subunit gamma
MNAQRGAWLSAALGERRFGLKGPGAAAALTKLGYSLPEPNTWAPLNDGAPADTPGVVGRLGNTEFFIEEAGDAPGIARLESSIGNLAGVYPVLREDCALVLGGSAAGAVLAQVCNVDLPALDTATRPVVMTLMIGVGVLVLPQASPRGTIYRIWCDPSFGEYLRTELAEIITRIPTGSAQ